jgi:hypothetical protein
MLEMGEPSTLSLHISQLFVPNSEHLAHKTLLKRATKALPDGQGQDPLPDRAFGHHSVSQTRGKHRHPASRAGRTHAATFARKRNDAVASALSAPDPARAVAQDVTTQISP